MPSEPLLAGIFSRGEAAAATSSGALLSALLEVETALARAWALAGVIPAEAAGAIAAACLPAAFDDRALGREAADHAQPVVGLVRALREAVGPPHAEYVHHGATSQDVLDTALMLIARRALGALIEDLEQAAARAAEMARTYADVPMLGRTLLQAALPTTFGLKAAGWMSGIDGAVARLVEVRDSGLAVQLGGPVGALDEPAVVSSLADQLGLSAPSLAWAADRRRPAELAAALGVAAGSVAKIARDVTLLAQSEVGEVTEGSAERGGSSSMAHKHNPVAAISALACAQRTPGLVATMLAAMAGEHERAAGAWQAEWETLPELIALTGSAAAWTRDSLTGLKIHPERMATNLEASGVPVGDSGDRRGLIARALAARGEAP